MIIGSTLLGLAIGAAAGYVLGAVVGAILAWSDNATLTSAHASYMFWANFMGVFVAVFSTPIGVVLGLLYGIGRYRLAALEE